jgi:hypothetical protein
MPDTDAGNPNSNCVAKRNPAFANADANFHTNPNTDTAYAHTYSDAASSNPDAYSNPAGDTYTHTAGHAYTDAEPHTSGADPQPLDPDASSDRR